MSKYYSKFNYNNYDTRKYKQKENYHNNRNLYTKNNKNNYYYPKYNNRRKKKSYESYEEETSYEKEATFSINTPSTIDNSFSQSSNSDSIKYNYPEYNTNSHDNSIAISNNSNNKMELLNFEDDFTPKINLSESEFKTAYYKPKKFSSKNTNSFSDKNSSNEDKNENTIILEINIKISKDKVINFKLRKYDDMFQVTKDECIKNGLNVDYTNFFIFKIIKALNSIYGIYNISLFER